MKNFHPPGHQDILGNEIANRLAKSGTQENPILRVIDVPFAARKKSSKAGWSRALELLEGSQGLPLVQTADEMSPC